MAVELSGIVPQNSNDLEIHTRMALEDIARDNPLLDSLLAAIPIFVPEVKT